MPNDHSSFFQSGIMLLVHHLVLIHGIDAEEKIVKPFNTGIRERENSFNVRMNVSIYKGNVSIW